jgi:hypothetical protein
MDRTLILDEEGNAVITCNESYDIITFLIGESYDRRGLIPGKKFSLSGVGSLKAIRDYLNCVITREEQLRILKKQLEEYSAAHLEHPTEDNLLNLKSVNRNIRKLKGNSINGRKI